MLVKKPCGRCKGKGRIKVERIMSVDWITCPICDGTGQVRVAKNSVRHAACRGTGIKTVEKLLGHDERECEECKGTGWAVPPEY
jgi:DnaJ-class molecular chaperone